jgi:DNA-binding transcriptional LysR family regulator
MELLQLRYLCTAARYENFSRAARHHNIPQSAISKTIAQLERELGVELFVRKGNRVALSEAGERFCRTVQEALDLLHAASEELRSGDTALRGELRLLVEEHYSATMRVLADFRRAYPQIEFRIARRADGFDYDLRISATSEVGDKLGSLALRDTEVSVLLPAMHRLAAWERIPAESLREERAVVLAPETRAFATAKERLAEIGVSLPSVLVCEDSETLLDAVGAGLGIAFVSGVTHAEAGTGGVALRTLAGKPLAYPTCLSWKAPLSPVAEAFSAALVTRLKRPE